MKEESETPEVVVARQDEPLEPGKGEENSSNNEPEPANDATIDPAHTQVEDSQTEKIDENSIEAETKSHQRKPSDEGAGLESLDGFEAAGLALASSALTDPIPPIPESKAVHPKRKEELLRDARADRLRWISKAPNPYRKHVDPNNPWSRDERLSTFRSVAEDMPAAVPLLEQLYGKSDSMGSRIDSVLEEGWKEKVLDDQVMTEEEMGSTDDPVHKSYHRFLTLLQDPACAMLVQGIRRFCHNIEKLHDKAAVSSQVKTYLASTMSSLKSHVTFKGQNEIEVRRSLESFVYSQCDTHLSSILWNKEAEIKDKAWLERLSSLQFVTPTHLEIACLGEGDLDDLLKDPIEALLSVNSCFSPFEKLDRILGIYRGVNAALSEALNRRRSSSDSGPQKLPSADDVLPAIILVLLKAQPSRLLVDLEIVEEWSPAEYLRGEAGYAYTNLYGAVHFLQELDLNEPSSLSISPEDFRKGLESCRAKADERLLANTVEGTDSPEVKGPEPEPFVSPLEVRQARLRGETVDEEWAQRTWQQSCQADSATSTTQEAPPRRSAFDEAFDGLPASFNRNYTFLTARPEDIKLSDLPELLAEYRTLVQTTEKLIGDRAAKIIAARKLEAAEAEKDLFERVREVDPSLLPSSIEKSRKYSL